MANKPLTPPNPTGRPTWAEIDLKRLGENFRAIKNFCGREISYMAVVKADAYGHGAVECSRVLEGQGADWFAVATAEEGIALRQAGIVRPILVLGGIWPDQVNIFLNFDLTPVIFTIDQAEALNAAANSSTDGVGVHLKIDTGMNRVGFRSELAGEVAQRMAGFRNLRVDGLLTHFAVADQPSENEFSSRQIAAFERAVVAFHEAGHRPVFTDLANSPAAVLLPHARSKMVRIGGLLYGLGGDVLPEGFDQPELSPVMSVCSTIAMLKMVPKGESIGYGRTFTTTRDTLVATIPIGYHDGYPRALSNNGEALVRGHRVPVVGRISMDWVTLDVTSIADVAVLDRVTLIGSQGNESINAEHLARKTGTISYEITCGIASRVPRVYITQSEADYAISPDSLV